MCSQNLHSLSISLYTSFEQWVLGKNWAGDWWWQCNTAFAHEWNVLHPTQYMQGWGEKITHKKKYNTMLLYLSV